MSIAVKKFNWVQTPTAWQQAKAWRASQRKIAQQSNSSGIFSATFANAAASEAQGNAKLAMQAAVTRIKAKAAVDKTA